MATLLRSDKQQQELQVPGPSKPRGLEDSGKINSAVTLGRSASSSERTNPLSSLCDGVIMLRGPQPLRYQNYALADSHVSVYPITLTVEGVWEQVLDP